MRVGLDAHMVGQHETGNETYVLGLLYGFERIGFAVNAYVLDGLPSSIHRARRIWLDQPLLRIPAIMPLLALRDRLDLYHATYVLPPILPCPAVVTVHDITFALHPEWFSTRDRMMLGTLVPRALKQAAHIIAISECTKQDVVRVYGVDPARITVTYLAPRPAFLEREAPVARQEFLLYVGNVEPRKNVSTVLRGLSIVHDRGSGIPLVIAGKPGLASREVEQLARDLGLLDDVRFTGYVSDAELRRLYATCAAVVHPALYEGFGLTLVEAMAQGAPVIASNASSIPEVVGDAGILVKPADASAWAQAMSWVAGNAQVQADLSARGLDRARSFTWERCAGETLDVYRSVLREG